MVKFREVRQGYQKEEVDDYIDMIVTEYEAVQGELKNAKKEIRMLKKSKRKLEESNKKLNTKDGISYQETIAAAMMGADVSGKWIIEEAKKDVINMKREANREVSAIRKSKREALREVRILTKKLQTFLKESQKKTPISGESKQMQ
jgi:DivIVA domain